MGYIVLVDDQTILDNGITLGDLAVGDVVEISGLPDELGKIRATYLEKDDSPFSEGEVKGEIHSLNTILFTFNIGELTIYYENSSLPSELLADGQWAEVHGDAFTDASYGLTGSFTATSVEQTDNSPTVVEGEHVELEGFVTNIDDLGAQKFMLGSQQVQINGQTIYTGGSITDLVLGVKIEVEGSWSGSTLIAEEIEFE